MPDLNRRTFLGRGTLAAAAAGGAIAVPKLLQGDAAGASPATARGDAAKGAAAEAAALPDAKPGHAIILHVTDASTGAISAHVGERTVNLTDRALVARVLRATA